MPAVRLERAARSQQAHPLHELAELGRLSRRALEVAIVHVEQRRRRRGALDVAAQLDELPALAVRHRRVGDALEQVHAFHHRRQELVCAGAPLRLGRVAPHVEEQPVDLLPHLGADLLAHLARVLARGVDARGDGVVVGEVQNRAGRHDFRMGTVGRRRRHPKAGQQPAPVPRRVDRRPVQRQVQVHVHEPRRVLGALEVPAHPVEAVGDSRQHGAVPSAKCQVPSEVQSMQWSSGGCDLRQGRSLDARLRTGHSSLHFALCTLHFALWSFIRPTPTCPCFRPLATS